MNSKKQIRNSNFEVLRIISMILIVAHHYSVHGGFTFANSLSIPNFFVQLLALGGKIGVNCFMLISGYFLITKDIKLKKIVKLWAEVFFYSFVIYIIFVLCGSISFDMKALVQNLLPITFNKWWFISAYFILYLFTPFINKFLASLDQMTYKRFLCLMFGLWCIGPTFLNQFYLSNQLIWLFFLYCVAGYIRLFSQNIQISAKKCFFISLLLFLCTFGLVLIFDYLGVNYLFFKKHTTYFNGMQIITTFLISLFLFLGFKNKKAKYSKLINFISPCTFGVYLIHDNIYVRPLLWKTLFKNATYVSSTYFIPYSLVVILIVFIVCILIDLSRIYFLEKPFLKLFDKIEKHIVNVFKPFLNKLKLL